MSKQLNCKTIICKLKGEIIINLKNNTIKSVKDEIVDQNIGKNEKNTNYQSVVPIGDEDEDSGEDSDLYKDISEDESFMNNIIDQPIDDYKLDKTVGSNEQSYYTIEESINGGIESVRPYVLTTRKNKKVWHQCRWNGCDYGSRWSGAILNHCRKHLGIKPYMCDYCGKLFTISCNLKSHLKVHHGIKSIIMSNNNNHYVIRGEKSTESLDFDYESDQKLSSNDADDGQQLNNNSKLRVFKPSFINGSVDNYYAPQINGKKNNKSDSRRKTVIHNDFADDIAVNDDKDYEMNDNEEDISKYIVKKRYNKKLWYKCDWNPIECKYKSYRRSAVVFHINKHLNRRPFKCQWNNCNASFIQKVHLLSHQSGHRVDKPYKCNAFNCNFSANGSRALRLHKIRHSGSKKYVCVVNNCSAKFACKVSLNKHRRVHAAVGLLPKSNLD